MELSTDVTELFQQKIKQFITVTVTDASFHSLLYQENDCEAQKLLQVYVTCMFNLGKNLSIDHMQFL